MSDSISDKTRMTSSVQNKPRWTLPTAPAPRVDVLPAPSATAVAGKGTQQHRETVAEKLGMWAGSGRGAGPGGTERCRADTCGIWTGHRRVQAEPDYARADEGRSAAARTAQDASPRRWPAGRHHGAPLDDRARAAGGPDCGRAGDAAAWRPLHVCRTDGRRRQDRVAERWLTWASKPGPRSRVCRCSGADRLGRRLLLRGVDGRQPERSAARAAHGAPQEHVLQPLPCAWPRQPPALERYGRAWLTPAARRGCSLGPVGQHVQGLPVLAAERDVHEPRLRRRRDGRGAPSLRVELCAGR